MADKFSDYIERQRRAHGTRFNPAGLPAAFVPYFNSGARVRVRFSHGEELTGTIGVTTGWGPCFLLMRRRSDTGSIHTIGTADRVVGVQITGSTKYRAV